MNPNETPFIPPTEPWLRGTLQDVPPVQRAVLHALEQVDEQLVIYCGILSDAEIHAVHFRLPSVAFHLRHIARSLDRLLTYAEGNQLGESQLAALRAESDATGSRNSIIKELMASLANSSERIRNFQPSALDQPRSVGRRNLPTTLAGLLVHIADHTQRHAGQALTTAKILLVVRSGVTRS